MKVLFLLNGGSLGNATRCHALMEELLENNTEIHILTSDKAYDYFSNSNFKPKLGQLNALRYKAKNNSPSFLASFLNTPQYLKILKKNSKAIYQLYQRENFDFIFVDSEYSVGLIASKINCPIIGINNSISVLKWSFKNPLSLSLNELPSFLMESLDCLFFRIFTNKTLVPTLRNPKRFGHFYEVGPLVRKAYKETTTYKNHGVLVIPGGSPYTITPKDLKGFPIQLIPHQSENIFRNFSQEISKAEIVVANGGLSSLSEILVSGKKAYIVPMKGHLEQKANAYQLKIHGGIQVGSLKRLEKGITELKKTKKKKSQFEKFSIYNFLNSSRHQFSKT